MMKVLISSVNNYIFGIALLLYGINGNAEKLDVSVQTQIPRYVVYYNSDASPLIAATHSDYTHIIVSFVRVGVDSAGQLQLLFPTKMDGQWDSIASLQNQGKKVLISYGGGDAQTSEYNALIGREQEVAKLLAGVVKRYHLNGIDIDFEASEMFHQQRAKGVGDGRAFLIALNRALREQLPAPHYLLTHAPEPPYLDREWHGGPYLDILHHSGAMIDWITIQYYNNPGFNNPISKRATAYSKLVELQGSLGWSSRKLVVGKPIYKADSVNGHLSPNAIIKDIIKPLLKQYGSSFGGLAGWQFSTKTEDHQAWNKHLGKTLQNINASLEGSIEQ